MTIRTALRTDTRVEVAGLPLAATSLDAAVRDFIRDAPSGSPRPIRFVNAYSVSLAAADPAYREVLLGRGTNYPDGLPVGMLVRAKSRGGAAVGQVRGPSFFPLVLDRGRTVGLRHYLLGGSPASLAALDAAIARRYPGAIVAGSWSPPFGQVPSELLNGAVDRVRRAAPDVVWVALGTPKQDFFAAELSHAADVTTVGIGAAFDFLGGSVREAPEAVRRIGLEWLFRLLTEPRRLWRRYLVGNTRFLVEVVRTELRAHHRLAHS